MKNPPLLIQYGDYGVKNLAKTFLGQVLSNNLYEISFGLGQFLHGNPAMPFALVLNWFTVDYTKCCHVNIDWKLVNEIRRIGKRVSRE